MKETLNITERLALTLFNHMIRLSRELDEARRELAAEKAKEEKHDHPLQNHE